MRERGYRTRSVYPQQHGVTSRRASSRLGCAVYGVATFLILLFAAVALGGRFGAEMFG